jgi:hypothetical protein
MERGHAPSKWSPARPGGACGESHIVATRDRAYVVHMKAAKMPGSLTAPIFHLSRPLVLAAAAGAVVLGGTIALWAHYGTAVFYEMIVAGITACL